MAVALCPRCTFPSAAGPDGLCHAHSTREYPVTPGTAWTPTITKATRPTFQAGVFCAVCWEAGMERERSE